MGAGRGLRAMAAFVALAAAGAAAPAQAAATTSGCTPEARRLLVTYQPLEHSADATSVKARLTLANRDARCALPASGWRLYFNFVRQPLAVLDSPAGQAARAELAAQGLEVRRGDRAQSGDYYVLEPTQGFRPLPAGRQRAISLGVELWTILKTDAPAGFHIVFDGRPARWVPANAVFDPGDPKQTTAFAGDVRPVQDAARRFAEAPAAQGLALRERIVPRPLRADELEGGVRLTGLTRVQAPPALANEAGYLRSALGDLLADGGQETPPVVLRLDPELRVGAAGGADGEAYRLRITSRGVRITGAGPAGVLHGIQTLRQLVPAAAYAAAARGEPRAAIRLRGARIADAPLFGYRGLHIDVARHFASPATLRKFIDLMSFLKLETLHLHLTDDEGWRIEIPGLPELTSFGARRGYDPEEREMLHQAMGSGNDLRPGDRVEGKPRNETEANLGRRPTYQGFEPATLNYRGEGWGSYSVEEFQALLAYATARHISVVPEFDFPAHARAAVLAMERRAARLAGSDPEGAAQYRLVDPEDTSRHVSVQGYTDNLVNPCIPGTYRFLEKVVSEVAGMYRAAGAPLEIVNLGGDEPPGPDRWQGSPACKAAPDTAGKTDPQLMDLFYERWNAIALQVAPRTAGWEDILTSDERDLRLERFIALPWQNVWGWGLEDNAYELANAGVPVVLAHATNLYMDLAYEKDPDEPGYYWADFVDERKTFTYQPFDIFANATQTRWGGPFTPDPAWVRLTPEGRRNVLGLQAMLWAENAKAPEIREYQAFPKLLGAAERAWDRETPAPAEMDAAFARFSNTVGQVTFPLLSFYRPVGEDDVGVNYRVPPPGARIADGRLEANVRNPGLRIEYAPEGRGWRRYTGPVAVSGAVRVRTRAPDGRTSRVSRVEG